MAHQARKRFGQHFLHAPDVISRIVATVAPQPGEALLEIGPGEGAITLPLLRACGKLIVIELDRDLIEPLRGKCADAGELIVHNRDALRVDLCALAPAAGRLRVVGNLPYNVSTPLLFHVLDHVACVQDMHFMLQREVVARMAAQPGDDAYGRLSVMLQYRCEVEPLFDIGAGAFRPPPKVQSAFVRLLPHASPPVTVTDDQCFAQVVRAAFGQRRKTLRNSLRGLLEEEDFNALDLDPRERPERLALSDFAAIANRVAERSNG